MSLSDPIGDMIARIKNASVRNYKKVQIPSSKFKKKIADAGHDNSSYTATDETYENLHFCCKYRDNPE